MMETCSRPKLYRRRALLITALICVAVGAVGAKLAWQQSSSTTFPPDFFPEGISESLRSDLIDAQQRVVRNPTGASWGALGELCMAHELLPQAMWCFKKASDDNPDKPRWIYLQGVIAEEVDIAQAVEAYQHVAKLDSSSPSLYLRLGKVQARSGSFAEAENAYQTASKLTNGHPLVLKSIAQLLAMQGKVDEATEMYRQLLVDERSGHDVLLDAKQWFARHSIKDANASLEKKLEERPAATEPLEEPWFSGVMARMPKIPMIAAQAGALATGQQYDAALRLYDQLVRTESRNSRSHAFRAMVLMNAGDADRALEEIIRVSKLFPGDALVWTCRGAIEARRADYQSATDSLKMAVSLKPDYIEAHRALLMIYQVRKMTPDVAAQYKTLLTLTPGDPTLKMEYDMFLSGKNPSGAGGQSQKTQHAEELPEKD